MVPGRTRRYWLAAFCAVALTAALLPGLVSSQGPAKPKNPAKFSVRVPALGDVTVVQMTMTLRNGVKPRTPRFRLLRQRALPRTVRVATGVKRLGRRGRRYGIAIVMVQRRIGAQAADFDVQPMGGNVTHNALVTGSVDFRPAVALADGFRGARLGDVSVIPDVVGPNTVPRFDLDLANATFTNLSGASEGGVATSTFVRNMLRELRNQPYPDRPGFLIDTTGFPGPNNVTQGAQVEDQPPATTVEPGPSPPPSETTTTTTPTPTPPTCAQAPKALLTTYNGQLHAMLRGDCPAFLESGWHDVVLESPTNDANKKFFAFDAHSTSCNPQPSGGPWISLTCVVKPDGRICMIVHVQPDATAGDVLPWRMRRNDGSTILSGNDPLPAQSEPACPTGG